MALDLTVNEVALISEVPARSVEKAIEMGVLKTVKRRAMFTNTTARHLNMDAVCYLATVGHVRYLKDIPVARKKILMKTIEGMRGRDLESVDIEPGLRLDLPMIAGRKIEAARLYIEGRKRHLTTNPEIFGGSPIIRGTRIPVHAIRGRLEDGDTLEDLVLDYPDIPREAFIAADTYARTHPERGRPVSGGRPWKTAA